MTQREKVLLSVLGVVFLIGAAFALYAYRPVTDQSLGSAGPLYRNQFNSVFLATTTVITTTGVIVVASSSYTPGAATYFLADNSGTNGVSCYPIDFVNGTESTSTFSYGGGWWLAPNGGTISLDSVGMYGGTVWCLTGTGTSTVGIVAR